MLELRYHYRGWPNARGYYQVRKDALEAFGPRQLERVMARARQDVENYYLTYDAFCALDREGYERNDPPSVRVKQDTDIVDLIDELPFQNPYWQYEGEEVFVSVSTNVEWTAGGRAN